MGRDADAPNSVTTRDVGRGRILVVDDSRLVRVMLAQYLATAGFAVDQADDGVQALEMLLDGGYDVVVTDLQMPGADGFEVLAAAKKLAEGVEVIVLTGAHTKDLTAPIRALRMGAHDYLTKPPPSADEVVLTVERAMEKRQLRKDNQRLLQQLETLSLTDPLTGVSNRRAFDRFLEQEIARARRHGHPLCVVGLDIDHFKLVNDTHGHEGGDQVLRAFAHVVSSVLRKEDSLYRLGGEEFATLMPQTDPAGVVAAAERIVAAVASSPIQVASTVVTITTSAGAAWLEEGDDVAKLLSRADAALYEAKRTGRNRVCLWDASTRTSRK